MAAVHGQVHYAVRTGRLTRPPECAECGNGWRRLVGHHEDYNKPLDVIWLCTPCHLLLHAKKRRAAREALAPFMPADPLEAAAWVGCLQYALGNDEILAAFREATGNRWTPASSGLERMIDEAVGADRAFIVAFVQWFDETVWGEA